MSLYLLSPPSFAQLALSESELSLYHGMTPGVSPAEAMLTGTEPGQKRGQVWSQGGGGSL